jgi:hypothetical protein
MVKNILKIIGEALGLIVMLLTCVAIVTLAHFLLT